MDACTFLRWVLIARLADEGGVTTSGVGQETGFAFTRSRLGCYCVPEAGKSCSHVNWMGSPDRSFVMPVRPGGAGGSAQRVTRQAARSGPSAAFRQGIGDGSLLCMPGDEEDEAADGEDIWYVNALGPQEKNVETFQCGPCKLIKNQYSVPVQWLNLVELTDEYAIFKVWLASIDCSAYLGTYFEQRPPEILVASCWLTAREYSCTTCLLHAHFCLRSGQPSKTASP